MLFVPMNVCVCVFVQCYSYVCGRIFVSLLCTYCCSFPSPSEYSARHTTHLTHLLTLDLHLYLYSINVVFYYEILNSPDRACHLAKQVSYMLTEDPFPCPLPPSMSPICLMSSCPSLSLSTPSHVCAHPTPPITSTSLHIHFLTPPLHHTHTPSLLTLYLPAPFPTPPPSPPTLPSPTLTRPLTTL